MRKSVCGIAVMIVGMLLVGDNLAIAATKGSKGPSQVLRFRNADGWGAPSVRVADNKLSITLGFRSTPEKLDSALERILTERARRVITHAQWREEGKRTFVDLQLSRPLQKFKRKRYLKRNWLVRIELQSSKSISVPSYASVFPEGLERIVAEETERSMEEGDPDCGGMNVLRKDESTWSLYATLSYAQCLQEDRRYKDARKMMKRVIREAAPESPMGILAALRLNTWKRQKRYPVASATINWNTLPAPLARELGLRLAQRHYSRDLKQASIYFLEAVKPGDLDEKLTEEAQNLRFDLLQRTLDSGNNDMADKLANALKLPSKEHPAFHGVSRAVAISWARTGNYEDAENAASILIPGQEITLVDSTMMKALENAKSLKTSAGSPAERNNDQPVAEQAVIPAVETTSDNEKTTSDRTLTPAINKMAEDKEVPWEKLDEILGFSRRMNKNNITKNPITSINYPSNPVISDSVEMELALALQKPISMKPLVEEALTAGIQPSMNKGGK